jgi:hypothetical protein
MNLNLDISKIKAFEKIKNNRRDDIRLEDIIENSKEIAKEIMDNIAKNTNDKKASNKFKKIKY